MAFDVFEKMLSFLFRAYPGGLKDGVVPAATLQAYWQILKQQHEEDMKRAFRAIVDEGGKFLPSAAQLLALCKKFAVDRQPQRYHKELSPESTTKAFPAQFNNPQLDNLPTCSRDILPAPGRRSSDYSAAMHDVTNHCLDLIRAMKLRGMDQSGMADKIIEAMGQKGVKKSEMSREYVEMVREGFIPNASYSTCVDFALHMREVTSGKSSHEKPSRIGPRPLWTFSSSQKQHILRSIGQAAAAKSADRAVAA